MARKLASIQLVEDVKPVENSDGLDVVRVMGWQCVTKRGEFKVGDKVVYVEIDSIVPERPEFEFLRQKNFRIKTVKLRGQISQGICFPLSILPSVCDDPGDAQDWQVDDDVTDILDIKKWEPEIPAQLRGQMKGNFPSWIPKTDETRVQALAGLLERQRYKRYYITEKLDGSSMTVYLKDGVFGVCSRNIDLQETEGNVFWQVARKLKLEEILRNQFYSQGDVHIAFQGELIGPGIQGNKYKLHEHEYHIFNVYDIKEGKYLDFITAKMIVEHLGLKFAPVVEHYFLLNHSIDELLQMAEGKSVLNPNTEREGIVLRPITEQVDERYGRVSFKAISNRFLLKNNE